MDRLGLRLVVAHVQNWIDDGRLVERPDGTRNPLQTVPLLDTINEHRFDAVFGGGRRDEERARAKERIISCRQFRSVGPAQAASELWNLYNGRHAPGEHVRVFPISNWTELDVWRYIQRENIELPPIYYAHRRRCSAGTACGWPRPVGGPRDGERLELRTVRYRTVGTARVPARGVRGKHPGRGDRRGHRVPADRARRHPRGRPALRGRHGRPQAEGYF